jgi:hypothetical protein
MRRTRRGLTLALLAAVANLLIPSLHDAAMASSGDRRVICSGRGLVTVIVTDQDQQDRRRNGPHPFDPFCPDCPSCPLCPAFHAPPPVLPKVVTDVLSPTSVPMAWPAADDTTTPDLADWTHAYPRAPPTTA